MFWECKEENEEKDLGFWGNIKNRFDLTNFPLLNVLYMIFLQEVDVDFHGLDKLVSTIGVTSALTMTLAIAMPISLTGEDYDYIITRFSTTPYDGCRNNGYDLIEKYNRLICLSVYFHAFALIGIILVSLFISSVSKIINKMDASDHTALCYVIRIPIRLSSIFLVIGVVYMFLAFTVHLIMTMPNYYVVRTGKCLMEHLDVDNKAGYYPENTWMFNMLSRDVLCHLGYIIPLVSLSFAVPTIAAADKKRRQKEIASRRNNTTLIL